MSQNVLMLFPVYHSIEKKTGEAERAGETKNQIHKMVGYKLQTYMSLRI